MFETGEVDDSAPQNGMNGYDGYDGLMVHQQSKRKHTAQAPGAPRV